MSLKVDYKKNGKDYVSKNLWKKYLIQFSNSTKNFPSARIPRMMAEKVLEGSYSNKPILIAPPKPKYEEIEI